MNKSKQKQNKKFSLTSVVAKVAVLFLMACMLVGLVANEIEIIAKKQELEAVQTQLAAQLADNEELTLLIESGETEMVERVAREEYGYAAPNERVFIDVSGK